MVWQLGVVPYLNADPLAAALREPDARNLLGDAVSTSALVPSQLLQTLLRGELDAALVSVGGVMPEPGLRLMPDMCIASRGPVQSIQLYHRVPLEAVRTVALDASSRSAVALTRVLFAEKWRVQPEFVTMPPDLPRMLSHADAALLIGNPALLTNEALDHGRWDGPVPSRNDLGAVWQELTGLPFVYAVWAVPDAPRPDGSVRDLDQLYRVLQRAREWGMSRIPELAARGAAQLDLPPALAYEYLTHSIHYYLGAEERAGMQRFCQLAVQHGVLPESAALRWASVTP
jgi:chorismate dehydratase